MYNVILLPKAERQLARLPNKDYQRVARSLHVLKEDPFLGTPMSGNGKGYFSLRVWPYRVIYTIEHQRVRINVVSIGHRKDVYKKLFL
ncbi:hypothetical protein A2881_00385 [Candidatus Peribacteria bacterium RIFCSPHIGHO2_01_FULL_55_13]|nr:MAG: hypothetical protein A2881_00385 [Candidatus Peribacteria bacterium RIFCSPHIGHO2_01_FULL_55_13]OGJ65220.1 MAG: hypothetical protein A3F36_04120 [Candidatus Peribacteria bacterium RIFCSPHIGHO2_12_FULL_55_11]